MKHELASCLKDRGNVFRHKGEFEQAIPRLSQAIRIYADLFRQNRQITVARGLANSHNNRGIWYAKLRRFEDAIPDFDATITICTRLMDQHREVATDLVLSYNNRGAALLGMGDREGALNDFNKEIKIHA